DVDGGEQDMEADVGGELDAREQQRVHGPLSAGPARVWRTPTSTARCRTRCIPTPWSRPPQAARFVLERSGSVQAVGHFAQLHSGGSALMGGQPVQVD